MGVGYEEIASIDSKRDAQPFTFQQNVYGEFKRLTPEAKTELEQKVGGRIEYLGGGSSKNVFLDPERGEVFMLVTDPDNPIILNQVQQQVKFYEKYKNNEFFKKIALPITRVIKDNKGVVIGMGQKFGGIPLDKFKRLGGVISRQMIDAFIESYRKVIAETQTPHGNLVSGKFGPDWLANWDNILVDTKLGKITFADYNGRNGSIDFGGRNIKPDDPEYAKVVNQDPDNLRGALYQFFDYNLDNTTLLKRAA